MHQYRASTSADVSLSNGVATTILLIGTPSSRRAKLKEIWLASDSVTATDLPTLVEFCKYTSAGTSTSMTPVPEDQLDPAALVTAAYACTVEPTGASVLWSTRVSPIGTTLIYQTPLSDEYTMKVSDFFGIRCTTGQAESAYRAIIKFQE